MMGGAGASCCIRRLAEMHLSRGGAETTGDEEDGELEPRREAASGGDPTSGEDPAGQVARPWRSRDLQSRERRGRAGVSRICRLKEF